MLGVVVEEEVVGCWVLEEMEVPVGPRDLASAAAAMAVLRSAREVVEVEVGVAGGGAGVFGVMASSGVQCYLLVIRGGTGSSCYR